MDPGTPFLPGQTVTVEYKLYQFPNTMSLADAAGNPNARVFVYSQANPGDGAWPLLSPPSLCTCCVHPQHVCARVEPVWSRVPPW